MPPARPTLDGASREPDPEHTPLPERDTEPPGVRDTGGLRDRQQINTEGASAPTLEEFESGRSSDGQARRPGDPIDARALPRGGQRTDAAGQALAMGEILSRVQARRAEASGAVTPPASSGAGWTPVLLLVGGLVAVAIFVRTRQGG